jgi:protein involved in plasmid replication-relaxation
VTHGTNNSAVVLQPRDSNLLVQLATLRFVDREQAARLAPFRSATRAKARLLSLVRAGYLERAFLGTIVGGRKAIYSLPGTIKPRARPRHLASPRTDLFLEHQLAVSDVALSFTHPRHIQATGSTIRWVRFKTPLSSETGIIPDGYAEMASDSGRRGLFVEVDLGTESLSVWEKKVSAYLGFARSGLFAARFGIPTFRVLVVAESAERVSAIRSAIAKRTDKLFWLAELKTIKCEGIWSPIWLRPTEDKKHSLL